MEVLAQLLQLTVLRSSNHHPTLVPLTYGLLATDKPFLLQTRQYYTLFTAEITLLSICLTSK